MSIDINMCTLYITFCLLTMLTPSIQLYIYIYMRSLVYVVSRYKNNYQIMCTH